MKTCEMTPDPQSEFVTTVEEALGKPLSQATSQDASVALALWQANRGSTALQICQGLQTMGGAHVSR